MAFALLAYLPLSSLGAALTISVNNDPLVTAPPTPTVVTDDVIALDEEIVVHFSHPIADPAAYERLVSSFPAETLRFTWNTPQELRIIPQTLWNPQTVYSLALPLNTTQHHADIAQIFRFTTRAYPRVISTSIGGDHNYLRPGDTITVTLDQDAADFDIIAVVRPFVSLERTDSASYNSVAFRVGDIDQDVAGNHTVTVFARYAAAPRHAFYPIATHTFNTVTAMPDSWPKPAPELLERAKKATAPCITVGKYIDVNLAARVTTLFENGKYVTSFINSPGAPDTPTPTGTFRIYNKDPFALSNLLGVYMPYWMAFTENGEYGIHGLVIWPEGHEDMPEGGKESDVSIGRSVSPGCVRHDAAHSELIYKWTDIGTPIVIY